MRRNTVMKVHLGLNVTDLGASISFYTKVFAAQPVKVKSNYAKFYWKIQV